MSYDRPALVAELIRDEDLRLKVYRCTSRKLTIGVGRNLDDVGISAAETAALGVTVRSAIARGITRAQALALLDHDIDRCEADLDRSLPWWRGLSDVRQRVLLNMAFNLGIGRTPDARRGITGKGLLGFVNTLRSIAAGDFAAGARGMRVSKWADQVGARATRLARMMETGKC